MNHGIDLKTAFIACIGDHRETEQIGTKEQHSMTKDVKSEKKMVPTINFKTDLLKHTAQQARAFRTMLKAQGESCCVWESKTNNGIQLFLSVLEKEKLSPDEKNTKFLKFKQSIVIPINLGVGDAVKSEVKEKVSNHVIDQTSDSGDDEDDSSSDDD
jgi:hypothetical protein